MCLDSGPRATAAAVGGWRVCCVLTARAGCGNYEQLWITTSLRGLAVATLKVAVTKEGAHSGLSR